MNHFAFVRIFLTTEFTEFTEIYLREINRFAFYLFGFF